MWMTWMNTAETELIMRMTKLIIIIIMFYEPQKNYGNFKALN